MNIKKKVKNVCKLFIFKMNTLSWYTGTDASAIVETDSNGQLQIFHFDQGCELDTDASRVRGHVFENGVLIGKSLPFIPEYFPDQVTNEMIKDASFFMTTEGSSVRLFKTTGVNGEWTIATHRKLNGVNKWSGETFKTLFDNTWDPLNYEMLDSDCCYTFIVSHAKNRIVYNVPEPTLTLISVWCRTSDSFLPVEQWPKLTSVRQLQSVDYATTLQNYDNAPTEMVFNDILRYLDADGKFDAYGLIVYPNNDLKNPRPFKIISKHYNDLRNARGNVGSLTERFITLLIEGDIEKMVVLKELFNDPESTRLFETLSKKVPKLVTRLTSLYFDKFIKKNTAQIPKEEYCVICKCHADFIATKIKMSPDRTRQVLLNTPIKYVMRMLERTN